MPSDPIALASKSTSNADAPHLHPGLSLKALTFKFIRCAEKEELLTSSNEEESLTAHGLTGKVSRVCSHVFLNFNQFIRLHQNMSSSKLVS